MKNMTLEKIYTKFANSDIIIYLLWLLLLLLLVLIIKLQYFSILFPVIFANIGLALFLIFKKKNRQNLHECETDLLEEGERNSIQINGTIPVVSSILFLLIYSASLLLLFQGEYTKTVAYYLCISLCAGILIIEIFNYRTKIQGYGILLKAILLSINIVFVNHLIYIHGISLPDLYLHFEIFIRSIIDTGHISSNIIGPYNIFCIHHIFASEIAIVSGYDPRSIYLLFGSFMIALGVLFVFIIGKRFVNFQFGLVAAVLFTCLDYFLMYGGHPEHQAYNFGFALICFTIILFTYRSQKTAFYVIFLISTISLVLTHHYTAAIVFITVCSLFIFDIIQLIQKRDSSIPSKYICMCFIIFLVIVAALMASVSEMTLIQLFSSYFTPYFNDIRLLIVTSITSPVHTSTIPPTPIPTIAIPSTPIPTIAIPSTPIPTIAIPSTPIPTIAIPTTPVPITSQPPVPPTAYDKIPILTLFENTLGSSLLVLVAILGFCSYTKKRSWFGDITILNGILLSVILGLGILFSFVLLLPDRTYPTLQIFCLVFLGAAGVLWLYNSVSSKKRSIIVGCIFILVITMSFFSLASFINGFETSPFAGQDVAYWKSYTTSQDISFSDWSRSFIQNEKQTIFPLKINNKGIIDINTAPDKSYQSFDRTLLKTGFAEWGIKFGQHSFVRVDNGQFQQLDTSSSYYDNGLIIMIGKNGQT